MMNSMINFTPTFFPECQDDKQLLLQSGYFSESSNDYNNKTRMKKNKYTSSWYKVFSLIFLFVVGTMSAIAQTASVTGDWSAGATWGGSVPATSGTTASPVSITVNAGITLTVSTSIAGVYNIAVNGTGILNITSTGVLNATNVTVAGTGASGAKITMATGGVLNVTGNVTINAGATSTWVPPSANVIGVKVQAYSGGGGGSGASSSPNWYSAGGGAGGNYATAIASVSNANNYSIVAGAGGSGGTTTASGTTLTNGTYGQVGGGSSFGVTSGTTLLSVPGGTPGYGGTAAQKSGIGGVNAGVIYAYAISTAGVGYNAAPTVTIGTQWAASTTYTLGQQVASGANLYTVTVAGTSTSTAPTNTSGSSSAGTTGAVFTYAGVAAVGTANLGSTTSSSTIAYIAITNAGSGYTSSPSITIAAPTTPVAWQASRAYVSSNVVSNAGYYYSVQTAGTSASSGGPSVTSGTTTDGTITWRCLGVANASTLSTATGLAFAAPIAVTSNSLLSGPTSFLGGSGGNGVYIASSVNNSSGSGGGSASSSANGTAGNNAVAGTGGAAVAGGLSGNSGAGASTAGATGTVGGAATGIGNGGGGATSQSKAGGVGSPGQVILSYTSLTLTGTLGAVNTTYGTASATPTSFTISSPNNLFSNITVTPPTGYEVSTASDFSSNVGTSSAGSTVSSGASFPVTVYVRLAATATVAGSPYSGNITIASTGYSTTIATASSTVSKATLTVSSGVSANNKSFDNTTTATFSYGSAVLSGYKNSDGSGNVSVSAVTGTFASVGAYNTTTSNIAVTISSITLGGAAGGNYQITSFPSLTANITPTTSPTVIVGSLGNGGTFGSVTVGQTPTTTFTITTLNLTGITTNITVPSGFSVSPTSVTGDVNTTVTVTFSPSAATTYSGNVSAAASGATTATASLSGTGLAPTAVTSLSIQYTSDNTQQLAWSSPSSTYDKVLVFASTYSSAYTASGAGSAYTGSNASIASATTYGGYSLVYAGTGTSVEVTGLTAGTQYYYTVVAYASSVYSTVATANGTTLSLPAAVTGLAASTANAQSVVTWTNPTNGTTQSNYWDEILVVAYPTLGSITAPTGNGSAYTANAAYGSGTAVGSGYVVYKGTSASVTVTSLTNLIAYTFAAYTRHGSVWSVVANATATPSLYAIGDYVSIASGTYYAASNTVWGIWNGTTAVSTTLSPGSANNVWIVNGYTVTVNTTSSSSAAVSSSTANCKDLHVIGAGSTLVGSLTVGSTNPVYINGTTVEVSSGGTVGVNSAAGTIPAASGNNANALSFFIGNTGTTTISGTGGNIDLGRLTIATSGNTLVIAESLTIHYHGSSNNGGANGLSINNTTTAFSYNNNTITISNGATVTMDKWSSIGLSSSNQTFGGVTPGTPYAQTFTLNVDGTLTFLKGMPAGQTTTTQTYSNNGYLSFMTSTVNGATLNIGSTGVVNLEEFYPNGINVNGNGGIGSSTTAVINIAAGGSLNIDSIADFRNSSQTISGAGTFQMNNTKGSRIKIGHTSGIDGLFTGFTGTKILPSTNVMYCFEGTAAQVTGASLPSVVAGFRVGNSNGITLSQSTTVNDSLKLAFGILNTSTFTLTLGAIANDSVGTASSNTSYVNGNLAIVSSSSKSLYFPVGASSVYSPITLNVTQSGTVTYTANAFVGGTTPAYANATGTIATIDPKRYYTISRSGSGSVTAAYVTLGYSTAADVNTGINSFSTSYATIMRVVGSTGTSWTDLGGTGVATSAGVGSVTSTSNFASLGTFAVANAISLSLPPDIIAAPTATVSANYDLTYTDDATWRSKITSVICGTTTLVSTRDYTVSAGKITIIPNGTAGSLLRIPGTYTFTVKATGYEDVSQDQVVSSGAATKLYVQRAPVASSNGVAFSTQPIVYIVDAYNNLVTTASDNITPSNGGASNWSLGGTLTALSTTGGIATFTNLSGASASALSATITFTSTSYGSVTSSFSLAAPPTYYWVGGTTPAAINTANVWSTTLGGAGIASYTPSATDVLIFDGSNIGGGATGAIQTWGSSSSTTIGRIILQNNANVSLTPSPSAVKTYIIGGLYGTDLIVGSGSTLSTGASNTTTINIASGATAAISGNLVLGPVNTAGHTFQAVDGGAVQLNSGSVVTVNGNSGTSPFGTSASSPYGTTGSIVFNSGSKLVWNKSGDIFGGNKVVTFNPGSLFYIVYNAPAAQLIMDGNAFANIEVNNAGTATSNSGTTGFTCQSLKLSNISKLVIGSTGGTCNYGSITTDAGAILTLNTAPTGTINNSGTINFTYSPVNLSGTIGGTIGFTGTAAAQTLNASGTLNLNSLTVNNTAASSPGVTLSGTVNLAGTLTVTTGTFATGNNLTLKSTSITNTAVVGSVGGTITGTVTVERYIPAGFRAYRDMAPQVYGSGSIFSNWQSNGSMTSGTGIFITGTSATDVNVANYSTQPSPNADGLDYSINGLNSASFYDNSLSSNNWTTISNTKSTNLDVFRGYRLLIRGDRSFNLATTPIVNYYGLGLRMTNATTLKATGNLIYGTVTYNKTGVSAAVNGAASTILSTSAALNATSASAFSIVANPYACPVQWGTGTATNSSTTTVFGASSGINGSYWYLDPTVGSAGKYIAFNAQTGSSVSGYTSTSSVTSNGIIQPGQAIFIQNTSTSPSVVFKETAKAASSNKQAVFGVTAPLSKIYISLMKKDSAFTSFNRVDGAAIAFASSFTNTSYGPQDALKFGNSSDNLSISDKGKNLSIDGRLPATSNDVLPLSIAKVSGTTYQLEIDATNYIASGVAPYLIDAYRGTTTALSSGSNTINFTVDASIAASYANRFSLTFKPTTLAVNSITASATLNNKIATISWNTVGEKGVSRFEVEKSTDAKSFVKIGQSTAKNTATATYTTTDNSVTATTYYRVKAISEVGTVSYSNVAQLSVNSKPFAVYPNPLVGKTMNVSFGNIAAGKYTVTINNVLGQRVQEVSISHAGGNGSHAITVNSTLAKGTYSVTIRETSSGQLVHQSNLSVN